MCINFIFTVQTGSSTRTGAAGSLILWGAFYCLWEINDFLVGLG